MRLSVLMTVYNEAEFIEYAVRSCLPYVDDLVIVEGAYQETIALGASPRSTDGTIDKIWKESYGPNDAHNKIEFIQANEKTDKDQRNVGLEKIKELNPNGYLLIIDGDEVYTPENLKMVRVTMNQMEKGKKLGAYFNSLTFVNDFDHYAMQSFPRLFKVTPECKFVNDNFMVWPDLGKSWTADVLTKNPYIRYHHYGFCKGKDRFELKKKWWETRFGKDFDYGWHTDSDGLIDDPNHEIIEYAGKHPEIMKDHPMFPKEEENEL